MFQFFMPSLSGMLLIIRVASECVAVFQKLPAIVCDCAEEISTRYPDNSTGSSL